MIQLVPAIDIIDGKCVRLTKGDFNKKSQYNVNPVEFSLELEQLGFTYLHLVQLDNAQTGSVNHLEVLEKITSRTSLKVDYGGGIKSIEDISRIISAGAQKVNIGSWAVKDPTGFKVALQKYPQHIILSADVLNNQIAMNGWQETTTQTIEEFIGQFEKEGLNYITCTDISRDGTLTGPSIPLYKQLKARFPSLYLTASGGVSSEEDIEELEKANIEAVIIGKALYEGKIDLQAISKKYNYA